MSSSKASNTGAQINKQLDSLPSPISSHLPHVPESKQELKQDAEIAVQKSFAGLRSLAAGGFGGICAVIVGHPFDLAKVRLQTAERGVYKSAVDVVTKSVAKDGLARGLYAGVSAPLVGVTPMCMSCYYSSSFLVQISAWLTIWLTPLSRRIILGFRRRQKPRQERNIH